MMTEIPFVKTADVRLMIYSRLQQMQNLLDSPSNPNPHGRGLGGLVLNNPQPAEDDDEPAPQAISGIDTEGLKFKLEEISQLLAVIDQLQGP